jgi:DNA-binding FrmR family transcriptional regulator
MTTFREPGTRSDPDTRRSHASPAEKAKMLTRLRRLEGQVRGVQRMVADDASCPEVLTQLAAVIAAARSTGLLVLEGHTRGCVIGAPPDDQEATLAELTDAIERFTKIVA